MRIAFDDNVAAVKAMFLRIVIMSRLNISIDIDVADVVLHHAYFEMSSLYNKYIRNCYSPIPLI